MSPQPLSYCSGKENFKNDSDTQIEKEIPLSNLLGFRFGNTSAKFSVRLLPFNKRFCTSQSTHTRESPWKSPSGLINRIDLGIDPPFTDELTHMTRNQSPKTEEFNFRGLHPHVLMGTASDRYAGWLGQIYSPERYKARITRRKHVVGGRSFQEEVLPVDSVQEYFCHFRVLELDFTFYRPLLDKAGQPTQNLHVLKKYKDYLSEDNALILKAPQIVFAQKLMRSGKYIQNPDYLNPEIFTRQFHEPAVELLGDHLAGFIFEQEYQRKQDRCTAEEMAGRIDTFFGSIPKDDRYHVEFRTESYLSKPLFDVMEGHGIGQVLSHWTWLPSLLRQLSLSGSRFLKTGSQSIVRLLTPRGVRYEDAYARAHPFNELKDDMLGPRMIKETVEVMNRAVERKARINVIVNNRAGGNAPLIAERIAREFRRPSLPSS